MKIIKLEAENVKRIVAVEITPNGNLVQITGNNGQGKTSVLDAIWWALAGAKHIQAAPIRKGASQARIKLDLGEIVVTRTFKRVGEGEEYTTKLEVVGAVKGTPQGMLDSLLEALAFDPLKFARMDAKDQFNAIRQYVPDVDFDTLAAQNSIDYATRKDHNRRAKEARTLADVIVIDKNTPTERIDETALIRKLSDAGKQNSELEVRKAGRSKALSEVETLTGRAEDLRTRAADLLRQATVAEDEAKTLNDKLNNAPPLQDPIDTTAIEVEIATARDLNAKVALRARKAEHDLAAKKWEEAADKLSAQIEEREKGKVAAISKAKLPVENMSFGDGIVLLDGVPFDQASDAEQLKASCALAMAGNPKLRVIRVRDGSLLDEKSLALLATMAQERDYQVWIERVTSGENIGIVIEDGQVRDYHVLAERVIEDGRVRAPEAQTQQTQEEAPADGQPSLL